ncbi:MAG TPA: hypothetical protein IAC41_09175 [Candidatus Merdenecus merdavium]|nr:hypothetical protein [Candidatus Merdenecus merdavium]
MFNNKCYDNGGNESERHECKPWNVCEEDNRWNNGCEQESCIENFDCKYRVTQVSREITRELRAGICEIREGIEVAMEALKCAQRGNACQAVKLLRDAICLLERGIEILCCVLRKLDFDNCKVERLIEEAICDIRESLKHFCLASEYLLDGNCCAAAKEIQKGIRDAEDGLRDLCAALEDYL